MHHSVAYKNKLDRFHVRCGASVCGCAGVCTMIAMNYTHAIHVTEKLAVIGKWAGGGWLVGLRPTDSHRHSYLDMPSAKTSRSTLFGTCSTLTPLQPHLQFGHFIYFMRCTFLVSSSALVFLLLAFTPQFDSISWIWQAKKYSQDIRWHSQVYLSHTHPLSVSQPVSQSVRLTWA